MPTDRSSIQQLLPIRQDGEEFMVNARDLHAFLGVGKTFPTWIKDRIKQLGLEEKRDFICNTCRGSSYNGRGGDRRTKDYHITLNAAIQIAAQEKTARPLIVQKFIESIRDVSALWEAIRNIDLPDDLPDPMYVYAIRNPHTGNIKIGVSKDPEARLKQLRVGNDADLHLVLVQQVEAPNRFRDERLAHQQNRKLRLRGEWFRPGAHLDS